MLNICLPRFLARSVKHNKQPTEVCIDTQRLHTIHAGNTRAQNKE